METLTNKAARIIFAVLFAIFGLLHLANGNAMAGLAKK